MPKIRSHSGAKKRFKITKGGKVKHQKMGLRHLNTGMPSKQGRKLRKAAVLDSKPAKVIKQLLPYA
jgi:large subunit ribosomal protein L35